MNKWHTREQKRRYRKEHGIPPIRFKKATAQIVADRLSGKKNPVWNGENTSGFDQALHYSFAYNMHVPSPRHNIFIGGITT